MTLEDLHVHSTFSDGADSLVDNLRVAEARGLRRLGCVDHVRSDTTWVPQYVAGIEALRLTTRVDLLIGVEAKILNQAGFADVPDTLEGVDRIYLADHRLPLGDECLSPAEAKTRVRRGQVSRGGLVSALLDATEEALFRYPGSVLAHLFSILPKIKVSEDDVPIHYVDRIARAARATDAWLEIDERWRCPSPRTVRVFARRGVPVVLSTDSHEKDTIGRYRYATRVVRELGARVA